MELFTKNGFLPSCLSGTGSSRSIWQAMVAKEDDVAVGNWMDVDGSEVDADDGLEVTDIKKANDFRIGSSVDYMKDTTTLSVMDDLAEVFPQRMREERLMGKDNYKALLNGGMYWRQILFFETGIQIITWKCVSTQPAKEFGRQKGGAEAMVEVVLNHVKDPTIDNIAMASPLPTGLTEVKADVEKTVTASSVSVEVHNIVDASNLIDNNEIKVTLIGQTDAGKLVIKTYTKVAPNLSTGVTASFPVLTSGSYGIGVAYNIGNGYYRTFYNDVNFELVTP